jgi:hypothetical protein
VEVRLGEVDNLPAIRIFYEGIAYVPLTRNRPIECLRAGGNFGRFESDMPTNQAQRCPYAITGDAATDRVKIGGEGVDVLANALYCEFFGKTKV